MDGWQIQIWRHFRLTLSRFLPLVVILSLRVIVGLVEVGRMHAECCPAS